MQLRSEFTSNYQYALALESQVKNHIASKKQTLNIILGWINTAEDNAQQELNSIEATITDLQAFYSVNNSADYNDAFIGRLVADLTAFIQLLQNPNANMTDILQYTANGGIANRIDRMLQAPVNLTANLREVLKLNTHIRNLLMTKLFTKSLRSKDNPLVKKLRLKELREISGAAKELKKHLDNLNMQQLNLRKIKLQQDFANNLHTRHLERTYTEAAREIESLQNVDLARITTRKKELYKNLLEDLTQQIATLHDGPAIDQSTAAQHDNNALQQLRDAAQNAEMIRRYIEQIYDAMIEEQLRTAGQAITAQAKADEKIRLAKDQKQHKLALKAAFNNAAKRIIAGVCKDLTQDAIPLFVQFRKIQPQLYADDISLIKSQDRAPSHNELLAAIPNIVQPFCVPQPLLPIFGSTLLVAPVAKKAQPTNAATASHFSHEFAAYDPMHTSPAPSAIRATYPISD